MFSLIIRTLYTGYIYVHVPSCPHESQKTQNQSNNTPPPPLKKHNTPKKHEKSKKAKGPQKTFYCLN